MLNERESCSGIPSGKRTVIGKVLKSIISIYLVNFAKFWQSNDHSILTTRKILSREFEVSKKDVYTNEIQKPLDS